MARVLQRFRSFPEGSEWPTLIARLLKRNSDPQPGPTLWRAGPSPVLPRPVNYTQACSYGAASPTISPTMQDHYYFSVHR